MSKDVQFVKHLSKTGPFLLVVCVCVFLPFTLGIKFVGRTSRGHTGGRSHRISHPPSFCGAYRDSNSRPNVSEGYDVTFELPGRPVVYSYCLEKNMNALFRPSEYPPVRGKNVKTFRWDHRLHVQNL